MNRVDIYMSLTSIIIFTHEKCNLFKLHDILTENTRGKAAHNTLYAKNPAWVEILQAGLVT